VGKTAVSAVAGPGAAAKSLGVRSPMLKLTLREALASLAETESDYMRLIEQPKFDLGLYQPILIDPQTPHARDELYIVAAGTGQFVCADEMRSFGAGDVFFVAAGTEHRFVDFSSDFATWVIFLGNPT
jgi:mannose-6-phosphate isomerase-like protein (cupin superfamily)